MIESERKRLLELCQKIVDAENADPQEMLPLLQQLNELLAERDRRLKSGTPPNG
jgi:hypothetical protein